MSKAPIRSPHRGEASVQSRNCRVFEEGFTLVTLEEAKGPPDTRALAWLPAGPCCPPDGHQQPHSTPTSDKVTIKRGRSYTQQQTLSLLG